MEPVLALRVLTKQRSLLVCSQNESLYASGGHIEHCCNNGTGKQAEDKQESQDMHIFAFAAFLNHVCPSSAYMAAPLLQLQCPKGMRPSQDVTW